MKTRNEEPRMIVAVIQPSDAKAKQMCEAISKQFEAQITERTLCVREFGHSKDIVTDIMNELYAWTNTNNRIIFISCHSGLEDAIKGKNAIESITKRRKEGSSKTLFDAQICHYSTEQMDSNWANDVTCQITKNPNDENHQTVIEHIKAEYQKMVENPEEIGMAIAA